MNLDLFIETHGYNTKKPQHATPQAYLDKMIHLFNTYALKQETMTEEKWNILDEIVENKKIIEEALLPLKGICNYELSIVGGSLRDLLLNKPESINDYDIVISCKYTNHLPIIKLAKEMGINVDLSDDELMQIKAFRIEAAREQKAAQDTILTLNNEQYLIQELEKEFYFSKIVHKLMMNAQNISNYKYFSSNNVKDEYMNFHITGINQFTGINNKKVDLIVSDYLGMEFLSTFDFEICKIFADLKKSNTKEELLNNIIPTGSMLRDIEDKTFSVNATKFPIENLDYFFNKHLLKLKDKYPNYQVNLFTDKPMDNLTLIEKERWVHVQYLQMNFNVPEKAVGHKKMKL